MSETRHTCVYKSALFCLNTKRRIIEVTDLDTKARQYGDDFMVDIDGSEEITGIMIERGKLVILYKDGYNRFCLLPKPLSDALGLGGYK